MPRLRDILTQALEWTRPSDGQRMLLWAALVGVGGALATLAFREGLVALEGWLYGTREGLVQAAIGLVWWQRLLVPAVGGLLAGGVLLLAQRLPQGEGRDGDYMEAVVLGRGRLGTRHSLLRALSSACSVVSGGAIGREGPMVQLAALAGSWAGHWRDLPLPRRRLLVACGAAAGLTTAYNAPVAGALFIAEIVLQSLATDTLAPLLVAAVMAEVTLAVAGHATPLYLVRDVPTVGASATLACAVLGLLAGLAAPVYLGLLDAAKALFARWHAPLPLQLAAGGLVVGALSIRAPQVWGNGFSVVSSMLVSPWTWQALLAVLVFKLLAVAATTGSGAVGGIFTPTLFMGAVAGALFGLAMQAVAPGLLPLPAAIAIGMGALLAASTHAPLMSVLMIFEMTADYAVVVPLMLACVLAFSVSRLLRPASIYATSRAREAAVVPRLATAGALMRRESMTIQPGQPVAELESRFLAGRWRHTYVLDAQGRFLGAVALHDFTSFLKAPHDAAAPWPAVLLIADFPRLREDMPLWEVLDAFTRHPGERLPVVDGRGRLQGHVAKTDLVLMLREQLAVG
ncbi:MULTISPECIES: ClcB-like voltage-gated chloride channel protein [Ramlibacter]|uniref:ClcB-like voltage-gated chloride channel protein n=1 Tax=Ramlibacter aquaticus TaxID=2780094 RepID=A0ABR9SDV4_9BURK|nr:MULTISPECIES: ClcB-like voltage-gated chloride channel protein [Ramlibacter]MBE7939917.1 ClcB-like voltage-gated chloride channel protein [Ramlibacter aquaticus]